MSFTFIDFYAGIGGFRLGMERAGHRCIGYVEWDKFARKSYEAIHNVNGEWTEHDINKVKPGTIPAANAWCFGFPCGDISIAGEKKGLAGARSGLFYKTIELLKSQKEEDKPQYLFIENVKNLFSVNGGWDFARILISLDEAGYDAEWELLNSKDFGVPQNRERVFIIGHSRRYSRREVFPIRRHRTETSIEMIGSTQPEGSSRLGTRDRVYDVRGIMATLSATDYKQPKQVLVKGMLDIKGKEQIRRVYGAEGISPCLTTMQGGGQEPKIIQYNIEMPVTVRKYVVDIEGLKQLLKESKENSKKSIKQIADELHVKKTTVEHWFRNDQCFSIPDANIWFQLKKILNIVTDKYDASITEFVEKPNEYEKSGRVYHVDGLAPTLTRTSADEKIIQPVLTPDRIEARQNGRRIKEPGEPMFTLTAQDKHGIYDGFRIRKLTPRECWRLQGFPDWAFDRAEEVNSPSQLYKQAGNSVTVPVIYEIAKRLV
ncbi:DNA (cytosine-5-)-methyltransferase [Bacillus bombysepticus]